MSELSPVVRDVFVAYSTCPELSKVELEGIMIGSHVFGKEDLIRLSTEVNVQLIDYCGKD